jgi:hypothetical protein
MISKFAVLLILMIGGSAAFGFWGFAKENGELVCPFSMMFKTACFSFSDILAFVIHHLSELKNLNQGIVKGLLSASLALLFFAFLFSAIVRLILGGFFLSRQNLRRAEERVFESGKNLLKWLLLRNKLDDFAA